MSKKHKHVNETVNEVVTETEIKEEGNMTEKKGFINAVKEFGNKIPKPVKVIAGVLVTGAAAAGTALVVISKVRNGEDDESLDELETLADIEDSVSETETVAETSEDEA